MQPFPKIVIMAQEHGVRGHEQPAQRHLFLTSYLVRKLHSPRYCPTARKCLVALQLHFVCMHERQNNLAGFTEP